MISMKRLNQLGQLLHDDGIELSDDSLLGVGLWLLERARSINFQIPSDKLFLYQKICKEIALSRSLYNDEKMRNHGPKQCSETSEQ